MGVRRFVVAMGFIVSSAAMAACPSVPEPAGPIDRDAMVAQVNQRLQLIDAQVAAGARHRTSSSPTLTRINPTHRVDNMSVREQLNGITAQYFAVVGPDGNPVRLWLVDAEPGISDATNLTATAEAVRWNALPTGDTATRYALVPLEMRSRTTTVHLH
jgi:hypothetical protein